MILKNLFLIITLAFLPSDCETVHGCIVNGVFYPDGEVVPQDDPCNICNCVGNELKCSMMSCTEPSPGCVTQNNPEKCCPEILFCGCLVEDKIYKIGEKTNTDPCYPCTCVEDIIGIGVYCEFVCCDPIPQGCLAQRKPGQCCSEILHCGCTVNGTLYPLGSVIPDDDPCNSCYCNYNGEVLCEQMECCIVNGIGYPFYEEVPSTDPCSFCYCGENGEIRCEMECCMVDGIMYPFGSDVPDDDPCNSCYCSEIGPQCEMKCCMVDGTLYPYESEVPSDDPCLTCYCDYYRNFFCEQKECCIVNGIGYPFYEEVPSTEPCNFCYCGENGEIRCEMECCMIDGTMYSFGSDVPNDDPCLSCYCHEIGEVACEQMECSYPPPGCENAQPFPGVCCPDYQALGCEL